MNARETALEAYSIRANQLAKAIKELAELAETLNNDQIEATTVYICTASEANKGTLDKIRSLASSVEATISDRIKELDSLLGRILILAPHSEADNPDTHPMS